MFDFEEKFKAFSNVDLLKIVKRPGEYQNDAVKAATEILNKRQVSNEDIQIVEVYFDEIEKTEKQKRDKIEGLKIKAKDFFEPFLNPGSKVEPNKWLRILLLAIGLQYVWTLFETAKQLFNFFQCNNCEFDVFIIISIFTVLYVPLIFFLLLKRKRWGWILLFADTLCSLILRISQSYIFFKYQNIHHGDTASFVWPIIIKMTLIYFLWGESISGLFNIDKKMKIQTTTITVTVSVFFILIMHLALG